MQQRILPETTQHSTKLSRISTQFNNGLCCLRYAQEGYKNQNMRKRPLEIARQAQNGWKPWSKGKTRKNILRIETEKYTSKSDSNQTKNKNGLKQMEQSTSSVPLAPSACEQSNRPLPKYHLSVFSSKIKVENCSCMWSHHFSDRPQKSKIF